MSDDKTLRAPADAQRVNVGEDYEVQYWANKWNVTPERLRAAVAEVGVMADDVERELRK